MLKKPLNVVASGSDESKCGNIVIIKMPNPKPQTRCIKEPKSDENNKRIPMSAAIFF